MHILRRHFVCTLPSACSCAPMKFRNGESLVPGRSDTECIFWPMQSLSKLQLFIS
jgi:hypothetical protein